MSRLYLEIESWPFVFPLFEDSEHAKYVQLHSNGAGYTLSKPGLTNLLCNVAYLGWWYFKGQIVSKSNHTAIVGEDDFWYAFNRLSPYKIDGEKNTRDTSQVRNRTDKPDTLLEGMIRSSNERKVYAISGAYSIVDPYKKQGDHFKTSIGVTELDNIYLDRLFTVLNDKEHGETIEQRLKEVQAIREHALVSVDTQVEETRTQIARAERDKRIAEDEDYEDGIRAAIRELKRLRSLLSDLKDKQIAANTDELSIRECQDLLECVRDGWDNLAPAKRLRFIRLITQSMVLVEASTHFLKVKIKWTGPYSCVDVGYIWRGYASGGMYTEEENTIIRELYSIADRAVILEKLPTRFWSGIVVQARRLGLSRDSSCGNSSAQHRDISYQDSKIMEMLGVQYSVDWPDKHTFWVASTNDKADTSS